MFHNLGFPINNVTNKVDQCPFEMLPIVQLSQSQPNDSNIINHTPKQDTKMLHTSVDNGTDKAKVTLETDLAEVKLEDGKQPQLQWPYNMYFTIEEHMNHKVWIWHATAHLHFKGEKIFELRCGFKFI